MVTRTMPRLTMTRMLKLVGFAAVASAAGMPMLRLWQEGIVHDLWPVLVFDAVAVPLAIASTSFVLARRGQGRDRIILAGLATSVAAAAGFAAYVFVGIAVGIAGRSWPDLSELGYLATVGAVGVGLLIALAYLVVRLVRGPAPVRPTPIAGPGAVDRTWEA